MCGRIFTAIDGSTSAQRALAGAVDGAAIWDGKNGGATPAANAGGMQAMKGEQHVS